MPARESSVLRSQAFFVFRPANPNPQCNIQCRTITRNERRDDDGDSDAYACRFFLMFRCCAVKKRCRYEMMRESEPARLNDAAHDDDEKPSAVR